MFEDTLYPSSHSVTVPWFASFQADEIFSESTASVFACPSIICEMNPDILSLYKSELTYAVVAKPHIA